MYRNTRLPNTWLSVRKWVCRDCQVRFRLGVFPSNIVRVVLVIIPSMHKSQVMMPHHVVQQVAIYYASLSHLQLPESAEDMGMNFVRHAIVANKPRSCPIKPGSLRYDEHSITNGTNLERYRWVTIEHLFPDRSSVRSVSVIESTTTSKQP